MGVEGVDTVATSEGRGGDRAFIGGGGGARVDPEILNIHYLLKKGC